MAVSFDTHKAVTRLRRKAGFDENQAMAVVETVSPTCSWTTSPPVRTWGFCAAT